MSKYPSETKMFLSFFFFCHGWERQAKRATYPTQPESCSSQHSCGDQDGGRFPKPRTGRDPKKSQPEGRDVLRAERKIRVREATLPSERRKIFFHSLKFYFTNFRSNFHKIVFRSLPSHFLFPKMEEPEDLWVREKRPL